MKTTHSAIALAVRTALLAAQGLTVVQAQEAQQPQAAQDQQEVTVYGQAETYRPDDQTTATGLRMKLIDTPQSISVVSEEMLKLFNTRSAYDAADLIPGVSQGFQAFGEEGLLVRGQSLGQPRINGINMSAQGFVDSFALDRLEVVRGPATVLYGITGAFGGELNQVLKKPGKDFHADFGVKGGDFLRHRFEADVTGAIPGTDERLKVRVVGAYANSGLPQELVVPPNNINRMMSAASTFDFTENTNASIYGYKSTNRIDATDGCPMAQDENNRLYIPTSIPVEHWYCNDPKNSESTLTNEFAVGSLSHSFANDWYVDGRVAHSTRIRTSDYVFGFGPAGAFGLADTDVYLYSYKDRDDQTAWTSNLSLGGKFDLLERTHQFLVGLEYQKQYYKRQHFDSFGLGVMNMFEDGGKGILADGSPIPVVPDDVFVGNRISNNKALRGSVQLLLSPTDRFQILGGVLTQRTDLDVRNVRVSGPTSVSALKQTDTVSRLAATYGLIGEQHGRLTNAKTYFTYSEGFQPNVGVFDADGNPLTAPQREKSYEVGLKTQWLDGNVDASIAAFHSFVTNVPRANWNGVGSTGGFFSSVLGGKNKYDGVDFEVLGEILPGWNADLSYAYIDARVDSVVLGRTLKVASVPKQQVALSTSYEFLAGPAKGLIIGASVVNKTDTPLVDNDSLFFSGHYDPNNQLFTNYTKTDVWVSYKGFSGPLEGLEVFGNVYNAFDERSFYTLSQTAAFSNSVGRPRTITVGARYTF